MKNIFQLVRNGGLQFVIFCLINSTSPIFAQWVKTNGPNSNNVTCLAVNDTIVFAGTRGNGVFRSTDNGKNWTAVNYGLADKLITSLVTVPAIGGNGASMYAATAAGVSLSTSNGNSWNGVNTYLTDPEILSLALSPSKGGSGTILYAGTKGGNPDNPSYHIFRSTNGGAAWTQVTKGLSNDWIHAFAFSDTNILAGGGWGIYRSSDNGNSWAVENYSPVKNYLIHAFVTISDTIVLAGANYGGLFRSTDRGISWTDASSSLWGTSDVLSFALSPNGKGGTNVFAGTFWGVYLSTDYGKTWVSINTGLTDRFVLAIAVSDKYLFAGSSFYVWRWPLSEITTSVENMKANMLKGFSLQQNYPNPFTSISTIKYKVTQPGFISLKVFDAMGTEVATLINERKPAGDYSIDWNAIGLADGIYFCRLQSGTFSETKKLVLQK